MVRPLPDILAADLEVLIVALNPSVRSAEAGYSFASKGNPSWRLLHESGLNRAYPGFQKKLVWFRELATLLGR